jgi:hypothetical protein
MPSLHDFVLDQLETRTQSRVQSLAAIATGAGVPYSTLRKIRSRLIINPKVRHLQSLSDYFVRTWPDRKSTP